MWNKFAQPHSGRQAAVSQPGLDHPRSRFGHSLPLSSLATNYQRARRLLFGLWRIVKAMLEQNRLNQAVDAAMLNDRISHFI